MKRPIRTSFFFALGIAAIGGTGALLVQSYAQDTKVNPPKPNSPYATASYPAYPSYPSNGAPYVNSGDVYAPKPNPIFPHEFELTDEARKKIIAMYQESSDEGVLVFPIGNAEVKAELSKKDAKSMNGNTAYKLLEGVLAIVAGQYRSARDETERESLHASATKVAGMLFQLQQMKRQSEIESMEKRLEKLKVTLAKRETHSDQIIASKVSRDLGIGDGLGWDEIGANQGVVNSQLYYVPSSPQPYNGNYPAMVGNPTYPVPVYNPNGFTVPSTAPNPWSSPNPSTSIKSEIEKRNKSYEDMMKKQQEGEDMLRKQQEQEASRTNPKQPSLTTKGLIETFEASKQLNAPESSKP
jgi:hypothetical protein